MLISGRERSAELLDDNFTVTVVDDAGAMPLDAFERQDVERLLVEALRRVKRLTSERNYLERELVASRRDQQDRA